MLEIDKAKVRRMFRAIDKAYDALREAEQVWEEMNEDERGLVTPVDGGTPEELRESIEDWGAHLEMTLEETEPTIQELYEELAPDYRA